MRPADKTKLRNEIIAAKGKPLDVMKLFSAKLRAKGKKAEDFKRKNDPAKP